MMEGRAPIGSEHTESASATDSSAELARRAQFLATEHWSLLATRSLSWSEAFSRTSMFLSTLSAATVALALAGPAMAFGSSFALFALIVLSVTLFLGIATFIRLVQVNNEDLYWTSGMNLLRGAYVRMSPGIEREFVAGHTLDPEGMAKTFGAFNVTTDLSPLHALITTPAVVAVISSAIAGVMAGLVVFQLGLAMAIAIATGVLVFVVGVVLAIQYGRRQARSYIQKAITDRLPTSEFPDRR